MKYGYARVSIVSLALEVQLKALENENCDVVYSEKYTGTRSDRPQLKELLETLNEDDTLVVTKLDRLARNTVKVLR
jgi:DNA invertase Pin-like site-specific DNA recombinase